MSRRSQTVTQIATWRLLVMAVLLVAMFALLLGRLLVLQVLDSDRGVSFLQRQGAMRAVRASEIPAYRGVITDRRGTPLAVSTPVVSLWANPQVLQTQATPRIAALASALGLTESALQKRLADNADRQYMYLARHLTPDKARDVLTLNIEGVGSEREYRRFYPVGEVAAQLVGLTNVDGEGISGIEKAMDSGLQGSPGLRRYIKDLHGDAVRDIGVIDEAVDGQTVVLSIDLRMQYLQHRELQRAMQETGATAASAVTIDAWTGEVLAMSNFPTFNPNSRASFDFSATRNRTVTDEFEPGSTMKPLTLVAALESGQFTIDTEIDTNPGRLQVGDKVLTDPRNYGVLTLAEVIEKSSQIGVTRVAQQLGYQPILDVYRRFGLGMATQVGFPGEREGILPDRPRWSPIEEVTLAFGYGLTATPMQLAQAYGIFANRGRSTPLSLLRADDFVDRSVPVISEDVAQEVLRVLEGVASDRGTASRARVPGFAVGGKTGTVHKVTQGGYDDHRYVALFVGIAPMDAPRYVTAVVIDEPQGDRYGGGSAAAPVYSRITDGILRLGNAIPQVAQHNAQSVTLGGGQ
jgi:cell division protein FtsI (penicillin-binding protein 3)